MARFGNVNVIHSHYVSAKRSASDLDLCHVTAHISQGSRHLPSVEYTICLIATKEMYTQ